MTGARDWVDDPNPAGNPEVISDKNGPQDPVFEQVDSGVSVCIKFGKGTYPKSLRWLGANTAREWSEILRVKTGLGAFYRNKRIQANVKVVDIDGNETQETMERIEYLWPHGIARKAARHTQIAEKRDELYRKNKDPDNLPASLRNLDIIHEYWKPDELLKLNNLSDEEKEIIAAHEPEVYCGFVYTVKFWDSYNESLHVRRKILYGGIQIASNNMPQGELIQVPLKRYIGRQNNVHFVIHFKHCSPDLGRKGYKSTVVEFAKNIAARLTDEIYKFQRFLKPTTGVAPNLTRDESVDNWKREMEDYEKEHPLEIRNPNFFLPTKEISISSRPSREQDVIALFNQLLAGGVIRGLRILSTNERLTYDGLYRVFMSAPKENHAYDPESNPLGIDPANLKFYEFPFAPKQVKILEYKYSLDGLIEDMEGGEKNSNDVNLAVVWKTGKDYKHNFNIVSLLDEDNLHLRECHGITHQIHNIQSNQKEMDLIVLEELVEYLNDPAGESKRQAKKYDPGQ